MSTPINLTNFTFTTIGKQPDLLKRISTPHPNHVYKDNSIDPPSQHQESPPSRPTLLQVLADQDKSKPHLPPEPTNHAPSSLGIFDKRAAALFAARVPETFSQVSAPLRQASASRDELMAKSRLASPDFIGSMELVYPPTEPAASPAPGFPVMPSSFAADPNTLDSILTSLEQVIQALAAKSMLSLENARKSEALAQTSLATAKESVAVAQESTSLAQTTKDLVDQILIGFAQLVLRCKDEATGEQGCNLEYELEGFHHLITEEARDTQPTGLPHDVLYAMVAECAKKVRERGGSRKRKRSQDHEEATEGNDLPYLPHKERRIEQGTMSLDLDLEMEAEAARKAWGQEVERRSMVPPDTAPKANLRQQEQRRATENHASDAQQAAERGASETGQLLNQLDQVPGPASQITGRPVAALEQDLSSHQGVDSARGPEDTEDALQAQRRRELEERKLEIARFHIRERESKELQTRRKEMEKKNAAALIEPQKEGRVETGPTISSAPTGTLALSNAMASKDALPSAAQRKTAAGDISKKKDIEQRLAMEKQQASAAVKPRPAQAGDAVPQNHVDQPGICAKEHLPESQSDLQNRPQILGDDKGDVRRKQQEISEQQRNAEAEAVAKTRAQSAKFKERTNGASDANKPCKPKAITAPNVGNVVAQQTLAMSPKVKGKKSRNPQTPVADTGDSSTQKTGPIPPVQGFGPPPRPQQALPVVNQTAPRNVRPSSVPPIECIIEPSSPDPSKMELRPISQERSGDSQRALHPKSSGTINVSPEVQPAKPRVRNSVSGTTGQSTSGHTARLPRVSTDTIVPKVEIQSPTIAQSTTIQQPPPPRPPTPISNIPNPSQLKTIRRPTPDDSHTPHDNRPRQSSEETGYPGALDKNRRSNISSKKSVSSTLPIASPPAPRRNLSPQDGQSTDMVRNSQPINYEAQRINQQNDPPSHMAETLNTSSHLRETRPSRGWAYERSSISPPRSIGIKRPRVSDRLDDMDGRHWSPGQEPLGRRDRLARLHNCRTPSGSPPLRFRGDSPPRPLLARLEETQDLAVYRGGETYRPFLSPAGATDWDMQRHRDDVDGYPRPSSDSRPLELLDRFSNTMPDGSDHPRQVRTGPQHPKRQNGTVPRGTARRGRRGGTTLSLEQRIS
ncbi:hypothetical protein F5887DRAFT_915316 [Amanita rubescens]|nr:hypothetical protein F5887DRAFT_915316 [Amanita rubescens]